MHRRNGCPPPHCVTAVEDAGSRHAWSHTGLCRYRLRVTLSGNADNDVTKFAHPATLNGHCLYVTVSNHGEHIL